MKKKKSLLWGLLAVLVCIGAIVFARIQFQQETIAIAIAAPSSRLNGEEIRNGQEMIDSVQLYFDKVNADGGINGKQLVLKVYDDRVDADTAIEVAEEIVESPAVAVLGHSTSGTSLAAGKIYQKYGIPAITGAATADRVTDSKWYFRTTFNNSAQGQFIANYISHIFPSKNIYLIYTDDTYSETLKTAIKETFSSSQNLFIEEQKIDSNEDIDTATQRIVSELIGLKESEKEPDAIIMATQTFQAANIIAQLKLNGLNYPIFGGDSLSNFSLVTKFSDRPQEQTTPGFFTNKIHAVTPILFDIAEQKAQNFRIEFYRRYDYDPGWVAILYYDAAHAVVQAMQNILEQQEDLPKDVFTGKNSKQDRDLIRQGLVTINSPDTAIQGISRKLYFDKKGDASTPLFMGIFKRQHFISDFIQFSPIDNLDIIFDLTEQLQKGEIIKIGDRYLQKTNIVYTGIDLNEINYIDEKNSSYLIDFYLWFKYKEGNVKPDHIEFINYDVDRLDSGERLALGEPIEFEVNNGIKHTIYQMKADFYDKFDFESYPFDRQTLSIRFQHYNLTRDRIIYVLDLAGTNDIPEDELIKIWQKNQVFGNITDWQIKNIFVYQNTDVDHSTLGYEYLVDNKSQFEYSQFNLEIEIERDLLSFSIKNLLPLLFFVLVTYSLMFLPFEDISVDAIGGILLAVVFYHLSLLDSLPDGVGYVVALDYAFYLLYFLIGLQLLLVIIGHSKSFEKTGMKNHQLIQIGKITFPIIWLAGCLVWYSIYT